MKETKSAEEILEKFYKSKMHWKTVNRRNVLKAMEEYASQFKQPKSAGVFVKASSGKFPEDMKEVFVRNNGNMHSLYHSKDRWFFTDTDIVYLMDADDEHNNIEWLDESEQPVILYSKDVVDGDLLYNAKEFLKVIEYWKDKEFVNGHAGHKIVNMNPILLAKKVCNSVIAKFSATPVSNEVTRVEVIDDKGRSYINWDDKNKVELSYQDNGRTLKIFITR